MLGKTETINTKQQLTLLPPKFLVYACVSECVRVCVCVCVFVCRRRQIAKRRYFLFLMLFVFIVLKPLRTQLACRTDVHIYIQLYLCYTNLKWCVSVRFQADLIVDQFVFSLFFYLVYAGISRIFFMKPRKNILLRGPHASY